MSGKLYVVGTPIGNLEDITYRAVRILSEVDFICAEDTRVTVKLLNHFDIKKPLVSYHEHSSSHVSENIIERLQSGESCAVVTDAGMPCISDPGEDLVRKCRDLDIPVESVPGPTAMATAAAICGIPASRFAFEGFLSVTKKQRYAHLEAVAGDTHTLIFYEAPHKLRATLEDMLKYFGDRRISICRELTKLHEEVIRTTISEAINYYEENSPRGEYVLVVEGASEADNDKEYTLEDAVRLASELIEKGVKLSDACKEAATVTGIRKKDIYSALM
ncbi:MAG: 16S rRNA (cytidine(1402)-2'-O)-methyltransferase [Oscillospiraceae bacterium]|nr:16S rRNA (cytidine(1402)-2'-O)-methyltransferase [Oscillospiraceae bacterium]